VETRAGARYTVHTMQEFVSDEERARSRAIFAEARAKARSGTWDRAAWIQLIRDVRRECPWSIEAATSMGMPEFVRTRAELNEAMKEASATS
jgi:hypothetical protein